MKIGYLGAGSWGFCLAALLAENGHEVVLWARSTKLVEHLITKREHPKLVGFLAPQKLSFTDDIKEAVLDADVLVESVTSAGIRPIFETVSSITKKKVPIILTSKGIEQNTGYLLFEVVEEIMQDGSMIGALSGPSHAEEVIKGLPTSIVCSSHDNEISQLILDLFTAPHFRIYPNSDIKGVCFGGAMKNIIAIACGISDGLQFGDNTKAALVTRGLHEMRKLSPAKGALPETLNGLSGMGDLCVTCFSKFSRNYRAGRLIAEGYPLEEVKKIIGMAVEGAYTCVSALQLGRAHNIAVPITEVTNAILYEGMNPKDAVKALLQRVIKEEHL